MEKVVNVRKINLMRCTASLIFCIIIIVLTNLAFWLNLSNALNREWENIGLRTLRMFTTISNLLVTTSAILSIPYQIEGYRKNNYHLPRWIVVMLYTGVTGVGITFVIAITAISIATGFYNAMIKETNIFLHTINPIVSILMFTIVNDDHTIELKTSFVALIPLFIYTAAYIIFAFIIGPERGGWTDHYKFNAFIPWPLTLIIMYTISFGVTTLLRVIHNAVHKKRKQSYINYFQNSSELVSDTIEEAVKKLAIINQKYKYEAEIIVPLRSIEMMLPKYKTDKTKLELLQIYLENYYNEKQK